MLNVSPWWGTREFSLLSSVFPNFCKWVYKVKKKKKSSIECYKARLAAKRFLQRYGVNFDETFNFIRKLTTVKVFISLADSRGWSLW